MFPAYEIMKSKRSFKELSKGSGPNIEPWGIPEIILSNVLNKKVLEKLSHGYYPQVLKTSLSCGNVTLRNVCTATCGGAANIKIVRQSQALEKSPLDTVPKMLLPSLIRRHMATTSLCIFDYGRNTIADIWQ